MLWHYGRALLNLVNHWVAMIREVMGVGRSDGFDLLTSLRGRHGEGRIKPEPKAA